MRNLFLALVIAAFAALPVCGQHSLDWGEPSESEIDLKICPFDSSANAVVLAENCVVKYRNEGSNGQFILIEYYHKIKILNSNGFDYATPSIEYTTWNNVDQIFDLEAHTINIENGKPIITELRDKIFTDVINSNSSAKKFTFPSIKPGSILEYRYTLATKRFAFLKDWHFQHEIPTIYSEIRTVLPAELQYNVIFSGKDLMSKYNGNSPKNNTWSLSNVRGVDGEDHVFCYRDYINQIQFQRIDYHRGGNSDKSLQNWDDLAANIRQDYSSYLGKKGVAGNLLTQLINPGDSKEEIVKKIFSYIKTFEAAGYNRYVFQGVQDLIKNRRGTSAEINLLMCLLLNEAGIPSRQVLISTKYHGKVTKEFAQLDQFNHMIIAIEGKEGAYQYIDGVSPSANAYLLPYDHVNYWGYMISKDESKWVQIGYPVESKTKHLYKYKIESTGINIQSSSLYSGYQALVKRDQMKKKKFKEPLFAIGNPLIKEDSSKIENLEDEYKDYTEHHFYSSSERNSKEKLFLNLNFFSDENPFKQKERLFPVELDYPFSITNTIHIQMSSTDSVLVLPKSLSIVLQNEGIQYGKFNYKISKDKNIIMVSFKWEMLQSIIPQHVYGYLKDFTAQVITKLNEPIIIEGK